VFPEHGWMNSFQIENGELIVLESGDDGARHGDRARHGDGAKHGGDIVTDGEYSAFDLSSNNLQHVYIQYNENCKISKFCIIPKIQVVTFPVFPAGRPGAVTQRIRSRRDRPAKNRLSRNIRWTL
jgi:hypothetical protein